MAAGCVFGRVFIMQKCVFLDIYVSSSKVLAFYMDWLRPMGSLLLR